MQQMPATDWTSFSVLTPKFFFAVCCLVVDRSLINWYLQLRVADSRQGCVSVVVFVFTVSPGLEAEWIMIYL